MSDNNETQAPENQGPTIGVLDLQNLLKIVDAAAERGAFRGAELSSVGAVRDKVAAFLDALPKPEGEQTPEAPVEEPKETKKPARKGRKA